MPFYGYFLLEIIKIVFYTVSFSHRIKGIFGKGHIRYSACRNPYR